jgi:hypothetical protein
MKLKIAKFKFSINEQKKLIKEAPKIQGRDIRRIDYIVGCKSISNAKC